MAATTVTVRVAERVPDAELLEELEQMRLEAEETRARSLAPERAFGPELATEMLAHANTVKETAADLLGRRGR